MNLTLPSIILFISLILTASTTAIAGDVVAPWICANEHPEKLVVYGRDVDEILSKITKPEMKEKEKAIQIWKYVMTHIYHSPGLVERPETSENLILSVYDAQKLLFSYGSAVCGQNSDIQCALFTSAGLQCRGRNIGPHSVFEVCYENAWHYLDGDMGGYITDSQGKLLSVDELVDLPAPNRLKMESNPVPDSDPHFALDRFARLWGGEKLQKHKYFRGIAVHTTNFTLRSGEKFIRYFNSMKKPGEFYASTHWNNPRGTTYVNRENPGILNQSTKAKGWGVHANGEFAYRPKLTERLLIDSLCAATDVAVRKKTPKLFAKENNAKIVFHQQTPYVICAIPATGKKIYADGAHDGVIISGKSTGKINLQVAVNSGATWKDYGEFEGEFSIDASDQAKNKYQYQVKISFPEKGAGLDSIEFLTRVQVAAKQLPALEKGINKMRYSALNESVIQFTPDLIRDFETFKKQVHHYENLKWSKDKRIRLQEAEITTKKPSALVYKLSAPGKITRIDAAIVLAFTRKPLPKTKIFTSVDNGTTWDLLGQGPELHDAAWYVMVPVKGKVAKPARELLVKIVLGADNTMAAGLRDLNIYAYYENSSDAPLKITHGWTEDGILKTHKEIIPAGKADAEYEIEVKTELKPPSSKAPADNCFIKMEVL